MNHVINNPLYPILSKTHLCMGPYLRYNAYLYTCLQSTVDKNKSPKISLKCNYSL